MKKYITLFLLLLAGTLSFAHEFWLEPLRFLWHKGEMARIELMVGEDYLGEHSNGNKYKILKLDHYAAGKQTDVRSLVAGDSLNVLDLPLTARGNHLLAFSNTSKFIELEAAKFNNYLRSEGLDNAAQARQEQGDTLKPGRELFQRCVKTLVMADGKPDNTYAINTGMRLEIIPDRNPYNLKGTSTIPFRVLFDNRPFENALVLAWHSVNGTTTHTSIRADKNGRVSFPISNNGKWMISIVRMIPYTDTKTSDWQSFWGSYTFGYF